MRFHASMIALVALVALVAVPSCVVAAGTFVPFETPNAQAVGMSNDGAYAIADAQGLGGVACFRWSRTDGDQAAGPYVCNSVNTSGALAGFINSGPPSFSDLPFLLDNGASDANFLPLPDGLSSGQARANADTGAVVGLAIDGMTFTTHAFVWNPEAGTSLLSVPVGTSNSAANAMSSDGTLVGGWINDQKNSVAGVVWDGGQLHPIVDSDGKAVGEASAISANGQFVVGDGLLTQDGETVAWRWKRTTNEVTALKGLFFAHAVSDDGTLVTGDTGFQGNRILMVWSEQEGAVTLADYLTARDVQRPSGWSILGGQFVGVSSDGATIIGCCGVDRDDSSLRSFAVTGLSRRTDSIYRDGFDGAGVAELIQDPGFEATSTSGGPNPYWEGSDSNPAAVGQNGNVPTNFYSETNGGVAAHSGLWSVFFGGWENGSDEIQRISQDVALPSGGDLFVNYWRLAAVLPDATALLTLSVDDVDVQTLDLSMLDLADADFTPRSVDIAQFADGNVHTLSIRYEYQATPDSAEDGRVFIDDLILSRIPSQPSSTSE